MSGDGIYAEEQPVAETRNDGQPSEVYLVQTSTTFHIKFNYYIYVSEAFWHQSMWILCVRDCEFMHHLTACVDGGKFEEKVRAHTIATTCSSYCSYSPIRFLFFCSYSLVDFWRQGNIPRDKINLIDTRTIMWISSR
jgi:hypothetical protein